MTLQEGERGQGQQPPEGRAGQGGRGQAWRAPPLGKARGLGTEWEGEEEREGGRRGEREEEGGPCWGRGGKEELTSRVAWVSAGPVAEGGVLRWVASREGRGGSP